MEIDHEVKQCGVFEYVDVIAHHVLLVALEEVYLYAVYAHVLQALERVHARFVSDEQVSRCGAYAVVLASGVEPYQRFYALAPGISSGVLDVSAVAHGVPFPVEQHVGPIHLYGQIDISTGRRIILRAVLHGN